MRRVISIKTWMSIRDDMKGRITHEYSENGRPRFIGARTIVLRNAASGDGNRMLVEGLDFVIEGSDPDSLI